MGFWSTLGSLAKDTAKGLSEKVERSIEIADEYREKDSDFLIKKHKNGRLEEKMAAGKVLKERDEL